MFREYIEPLMEFVLFIGPTNAGKTTLLWRLLKGKFIDPDPTLGWNQYVIKNTWVIDLGGQEEYRKNLWSKYIEKEPLLTVFVIDITDPTHFKMYQEFSKEHSDIGNLILVANKIDLQERGPKDYPEHLQHLTHKVLLTSAKLGQNIVTLGEIIAERGSSMPIKPLNQPRSQKKEGKDKSKAQQLLKDLQEFLDQ